jgi:hypothetical protein
MHRNSEDEVMRDYFIEKLADFFGKNGYSEIF